MNFLSGKKKYIAGLAMLAVIIGLPAMVFAQDVASDDISLGGYSIPVILAALLGMVYKFIPAIGDRFKPIIAVGCGAILGVVAMVYVEIPITPKVVIDYVLFGFMAGFASIGLYEAQRAIRNPREQGDQQKK